jgi:glucan phosphoethanolaminetransferase (alkaline phosphatase superfamily)
LNENLQYSATWPTTVGAVSIIVGGLSLFGGCMALTGMSEIEQLHTAVPFGEGQMNEALLAQLAETAPPDWLSSSASMLVVLFSISLVAFGMSLLLRNPKGVSRLRWWAGLYIVFSFGAAIAQWMPRMELVRSNSEVQALFLAQLTLSLPLYLVLPVFLLVYLNLKKIRNEVTLWR